MRKWVDKYLAQLADNNNLIKLIIADVGDFPEFSHRHPDQFINVGVSESNAIGVAAGLASEGYQVFIYGVSSFFLYRAYEQFKYSISYWKKNVTFIGVGFGWKYYNIGIGHFCPDDIKLVQGLPMFEIYTPYNLIQLFTLLSETNVNPRYIRLTANIIKEPISTHIDKQKIILVSYGEMINTCLSVLNKIHYEGYNIGFLPLSNLKEEYITKKLQNDNYKKYIVIEDQCKQGGLYPTLKDNNANILLHICLPCLPDKISSTRNGLLKEYGLDEESIFNKVLEVVKNE